MWPVVRSRPTLVIRALVLASLLAVACTPSAPTAPTAVPAAKPAEQAAPKAAATAAPAAKPTAQAAAKPAAPAKPSGEAVFAWADLEREIWDPSKSTRMLPDIGSPIYESLYMPMPPSGEVKPYLVESGTMAADGLSWTLKLRDGIKFSNGDPMTAEDVKFSLERYKSNDNVSTGKADLQALVKEIQVVDRLTVKIVLNKPWVWVPVFLGAKAGNEGIVLPKNYIERIGWEEFNKKPIGSGPYKMVEHKPGQSITYEANENSWLRTPKFARLRILAVPEEQARIAMLEQGQADIVEVQPDMKKAIEQRGFTTKVVDFGANWRLHFQGAVPGAYPDNPLQKLEVRKALTLALNKQEMLDALKGGVGVVASYPYSAPGVTLGAPKLPPTPYDPAQAKQLLAQAGYPNGFELVINSTNVGFSADDAKKLSETVAGYWQQIGVKTTIRQQEYTTLRPKLVGDKHAPDLVGQIVTMGTSPSPVAVRDLNTFFSSSSAFKLTNIADDEVAKAQAATTLEEMVRYTEAAYKKVYDNYDGIGVFHAGLVYATSKKLADLPVTPGFEAFGWWLIQETPEQVLPKGR